LILDAYGTYGRLYIGAFLVGLAAAAIMLIFGPARPRRQASTGSELAY
jgi:hypothetical protein